MRRHLIISTTTSPSTRRATSSNSDFGTISTASPTTMSTIYQSVPNPYLTAVANDIPNVVSLTIKNLKKNLISIFYIRHQIPMLLLICIQIHWHRLIK
jgi:hypothetical protein